LYSCFVPKGYLNRIPNETEGHHHYHHHDPNALHYNNAITGTIFVFLAMQLLSFGFPCIVSTPNCESSCFSIVKWRRDDMLLFFINTWLTHHQYDYWKGIAFKELLNFVWSTVKITFWRNCLTKMNFAYRLPTSVVNFVSAPMFTWWDRCNLSRTWLCVHKLYKISLSLFPSSTIYKRLASQIVYLTQKNVERNELKWKWLAKKGCERILFYDVRRVSGYLARLEL